MPFFQGRAGDRRRLPMLQPYCLAAVQNRIAIVARAGAVGLIGLALGGCSMSYQMGGLFDKTEAKVETTGSVAANTAAKQSAKPDESDLARAKQAASDLFARGTKDGSQPWDNPTTGASGTVTPMAYAQAGAACRDFLASYVKGEAELWYQGDACKNGRRWEVRSFKPLRRT